MLSFKGWTLQKNHHLYYLVECIQHRRAGLSID